MSLGLVSTRTARSSVPATDATLKLCLCSLRVRAEAVRVTAIEWARLSLMDVASSLLVP